ncbi:MAG TPA: DMT family transporter [Mobilitalea sp.]|nr:DMT family transporter [Mobilitalea sp.]
MKSKSSISILWAILAAALYAISSPISKILLNQIPPTMMAALLYLGAGIGMSVIGLCRHKTYQLGMENRLTKKELPFTVGMVILDIAAPIFLMFSLTLSDPANVSLLNNCEIVTTSLIAFLIFKETISKRVWIGISLITIASIILSVEDINSLSFSFGSLFVLLACICWGFENNCTRKLSLKDPLQVVIIKGFGSGLGALLISIVIKETSTNVVYIIATLLLGFISYGLSIYFYVSAQRELGAAKTSAYYAVSPFIGVAISFILFLEVPNISFIIALLIMVLGTYVASTVARH